MTIMHFVNNNFVVRSFSEVTNFSLAIDLPTYKVKIWNSLISQPPSCVDIALNV